ncbi:hypothetical protein Calkr_0227 [Caldicellulosiruptor acetigenus I77R1B]|uniref:ABC-2 transporter permease n=2 Tax=Caldicellulosiruptor TaxID=44000 RepID=A0A3T0D270_9FIRM|nr:MULTISPECIES: ABC-2 transporter permease [Caldicellulosiruptor]ADQ39792.1 hypothetical protein Calkr_0227 [Caldicellulosiruptor acetigenus I77R1B]AZT89317.1 hypothetical protein ELD05_00675 [Caldicellulosiruptor changbaiensis]
MIQLIKKDICFNIRQVIFGLLASIFFASIIFDSERFSIMAILMVPSLLFSFLVGKMCYMEDRRSVYNLLKSLPISKKYIVISKYIESYLTIILGCVILEIFNIIAAYFKKPQYPLLSNISLIILSAIIIYNSFYLFLNFKYNYSQAQKTIYIIIILYFSSLYIYKYTHQYMQQMFTETQIGLISIGVSITFSIFLCLKSIKAFQNKE